VATTSKEVSDAGREVLHFSQKQTHGCSDAAATLGRANIVKHPLSDGTTTAAAFDVSGISADLYTIELNHFYYFELLDDCHGASVIFTSSERTVEYLFPVERTRFSTWVLAAIRGGTWCTATTSLLAATASNSLA
jgi:hypothetical protein